MKKVALNCSVCGSRNYTVAKKDSTTRMVLKKYCKTCDAHTIHKESL
ncbi:50S ribosomal protein L33 [Macrococcus equipercicus]|uniref:Large ribosomal subunit protein bL33 n=1 Tax=Macrococcus equipercicus TaxID=69967 RepID=A0A9Q9BQB0_9STAP|nr:50S ribosomal protein L33 [Macrococcus equipercicus]KAA1039403.1 50S ribosomal protein L33 [Macrococcus equipercicus]UTH13696.1 50S ribosomal protein L33 [Macrococcus equipercicus]